MNHEAYESLLAAYALGALDPEERVALEAHLREGCPDCGRRLEAYRRVAAVLPLTVEERTPRPEVKAALLRRVAASRPAVQPAQWNLFGWLSQPLPALVGAYALLLCAWGFWAVQRGKAPLPAAAAAPVRVAEATAPWVGPKPDLILKSGSLLQDGKPVAVGSALAWGADLESAGGSGAEILVQGHAALLLKEAAALRMELEGPAVVADLSRGAVFSGVVHGSAFSVRSGGARVDAHGTLFLVRHIAADRAYVCICRGRIGVSAPDGFARELAAFDDAHEAGLDLSMGPDGTVAKAVKPVFYSDADEDELNDDVRAMGPDLSGAKGSEQKTE